MGDLSISRTHDKIRSVRILLVNQHEIGKVRSSSPVTQRPLVSQMDQSRSNGPLTAALALV